MVRIFVERLVWELPLKMEEDAWAGTEIGEAEGFSQTIQSWSKMELWLVQGVARTCLPVFMMVSLIL